MYFHGFMTNKSPHGMKSESHSQIEAKTLFHMYIILHLTERRGTVVMHPGNQFCHRPFFASQFSSFWCHTDSRNEPPPWLHPAELPQHKLECWNWGPQPKTSGGCSPAPSRETHAIPGRHPSDTALETSGSNFSFKNIYCFNYPYTARTQFRGGNSQVTALHSSLFGSGCTG